MRKRFWVATVLAIGAAAFVSMPLAATGKVKHHIVLTERNQLTSTTTQAGTFVSAGAVNDAGAATATFTVTPHGKGRGELRGTHVLTGANGTITVATRAVVAPFPPPTPPRSFAVGKWRITGATGAYAGMKGHGKVFATVDFATGQVTIARDGHVSR